MFSIIAFLSIGKRSFPDFHLQKARNVKEMKKKPIKPKSLRIAFSSRFMLFPAEEPSFP
jgi:hypothetical protein